MQSIYTYIPETNYAPREYSVATILLLLFMVLISLVSVLNLLYFHISTIRSMYFLNDFEIVPVALIITGIAFVFTFHMGCISIVRSLYLLLLSLLLLLHTRGQTLQMEFRNIIQIYHK